jgi:hypothetical protein
MLLLPNPLTYSRERKRYKGREPKTCLSQVFDCKLGCFNDVHVFIYVDADPRL